MTENLKISPHIQNLYDGYYRDGDSRWRQIGAIDKVGNVVALCADLPHKSIIEIGAGEGAILKQFSEMGFGEKLYGLEISASGVETIRKRNIPGLEACQLFDGYSIPYGEKMFDLAVLSHVVEHVEHPRKLLYEAARVAKYVCVEVPLEDTLLHSADFDQDKLGQHINSYSSKTFRQLIQSCGFKILAQRITNSSKELYMYSGGRSGLIRWGVKSLLLRISPSIASKIFTYNATLVFQSKNNGF